MSLIFMYSHHGFFSLFNHRNNEIFSLLTIMISDDVLWAVIEESVSPRSECLTRNITCVRISACLVHHLWFPKLSLDQEFGLAYNVKFSTFNGLLEFLRRPKHSHTNIRIQLPQLFQASISSGHFANMFLFAIKVCSQVVYLGDFWIVQCHRLRSGQNQVLCDFNSEPSEAHDCYLHLDEFSHCFNAEGTDLPGVKVHINFCVWFCFHVKYFGFWLINN